MGVAAICAAAIGPFLRRLPTERRIALVVALASLGLVLLCITIFLGWMRRRAEKKAGAVYFQLAPHSYFFPRAPWLMSYIAGGSILSMGILVCAAVMIGLSLEDRNGPPGVTRSFLLPHIPQVLFSLVQFGWIIGIGIACIWWAGRVRLCEHGIVRRNEFVEWSRIDRHYWDACNPNVLVLQWGTRMLAATPTDLRTIREQQRRMRAFPQSGQVALRIPAEQREAATAFLQGKLPS